MAKSSGCGELIQDALVIRNAKRSNIINEDLLLEIKKPY
jgi:hypothetical protein